MISIIVDNFTVFEIYIEKTFWLHVYNTMSMKFINTINVHNDNSLNF